jgi:lipid II:glycine glycyltransferase (peptidoglycan interpeptide bridge formation enzyme)
MTVKFATHEEIAAWDEHILANPDEGTVFQGAVFAEMKQRGKWTPRYLMADNVAMTVLEKTIPFLGKLWYLPKGPGVRSVRQLEPLLDELQDFARKQGVFLVKIEPELLKEDETLADLMKLGLWRATPIQPNFSTVLIDLSPDLDVVMASLHQKGRHAIRRAERDGVTAEAVPATDDNCRTMYELFTATAEGAFRIRSYDYYKAFWQSYAERGQGQLFFAYVDGQLVAGAYALIYGTKSTYKDGASSRERIAYGASHLLQWRVIEWAKAQGSVLHDLCGVPPLAEISNPDHPHYGLGRFKTSFNKTVTEYVGTYDMIISPRGYKLWKKLGERLALSLHNRRFHENFY